MDKPKIKLSPGDSGKPKIRLSPEPEASGGNTVRIHRSHDSAKNWLRELIKILAVLGIAAAVFYRYVLVPDRKTDRQPGRAGDVRLGVVGVEIVSGEPPRASISTSFPTTRSAG